jgi:hypothetical protein
MPVFPQQNGQVASPVWSSQRSTACASKDLPHMATTRPLLSFTGLVERERVGHDSRVMLARLTPDGHELLRRAARTHLRGIREHYTRKLTDQQLNEVADALEVITGPHQPH